MPEQERRGLDELYAKLDEFVARFGTGVVLFDASLQLIRVHGARGGSARAPLSAPQAGALRELARRVRDTRTSVAHVKLDGDGAVVASCYPMLDDVAAIGVACVIEHAGTDAEVHDELVHVLQELIGGYQRSEAALVERERAALAEARRASQLKDQFLATISHELRAPIATVLLWERVLRADDLSKDMRDRALDAIHESATTQSLLVADLLDISRAISGKLHIELTPIGIKRVLMVAIESARPAAAQYGIALGIDIASDVGDVRGDASRLQQILTNLLSNAIRCTPAGGRVDVRAFVAEALVVIEVRDTGRGIAPDLLPHVFEPFTQGDQAREGLGLGLAISRQLADLHGGSLVAESAGVGQGAAFTLRLPRSHAIGRRRATSPPISQLGGAQVLVVDDDPDLLDALALLLQRAGARVETATTAEAGFAAAERGHPDIVLSDLGLPGDDGCSLVRRIRTAPELRATPAIAITSHSARRDRQRALDAGFDHFITKPLDVDHLVAVIARLVARRRTRPSAT